MIAPQLLKTAGDIPLISLATMHGNIVYLCGITADPANPGDIGDRAVSARSIGARNGEILA